MLWYALFASFLPNPVRIAIVHSNQAAIKVLSRIVRSIPAVTVPWTAQRGQQAVEFCIGDRPDLILMDPVMPGMDGVEATRRIMAESPCGILLVTDTILGNAGVVFEALSYGALDAVVTPVAGVDGKFEGDKDLIRKIEALALILSLKSETATTAASLPNHGTAPWIALGASTGGPRAVASILRSLPADLKAIVAIVQHLNAAYVASLATWLAGFSGLPVKVAEAGDRPQPGTVYIAGGDDHLQLSAGGVFVYDSLPGEFPYRPSIDRFFLSLGRSLQECGTAVLLTGMGNDGAAGLLALRKLGWHTIAQDKKSSVVFGMAKAAIELDAADEILPLEQIASAILSRRELR